MSDEVIQLISEDQMLALTMKADTPNARKAQAEIIEVVKAWARDELLAESATPILSSLYARARTR